MSARKLIVVGTSAGGLEALRVMTRGLPRDLAAAVLVVMHTSPEGPALLPKILSRASALEIVTTADGILIEEGKVYVAPPDLHLLVQGNHIRLSRGPKENRTRPAIDPLFRTAAAAYGPDVVAVILTGMLDDGTAGLAVVKERGGLIVVQDPQDALYPSMPRSAIQHVGADFVLALPDIAPLLAQLVAQPTSRREKLPLSRLIDVETRFAQMETTSVEEMDTIGAHAGFSCPECHGPIWRIKDGTLLRYRCHVGHAYSAQSMAAGQIEAEEAHLWQALRLMKERAALFQELGSSPTQNDALQPPAEAYDAEVKRLQKNIGLIQEMIAQGAAELGTRVS